MTRLEDALLALDAGADALGFVLAQGSSRQLAPADAQDLLARVRAAARRPFEAVAVLGAYDADSVRSALTGLGFDRAQLVGPEDPPAARLHAALSALGPLAALAWGGVRVRNLGSLEGLEDLPCEAFVLDAWHADALGGTGHSFDWPLAAPFAARHRVVLAGGLDAGNVAAAIEAVRPWRVDVSSGVEESPGIKSPARVRAFVEAVRHGG